MSATFLPVLDFGNTLYTNAPVQVLHVFKFMLDNSNLLTGILCEGQFNYHFTTLSRSSNSIVPGYETTNMLFLHYITVLIVYIGFGYVVICLLARRPMKKRSVDLHGTFLVN